MRYGPEEKGRRSYWTPFSREAGTGEKVGSVTVEENSATGLRSEKTMVRSSGVVMESRCSPSSGPAYPSAPAR